MFRGIQVVVLSDQIEIRYQVGLSDAMIRRELGSDASGMGGAEVLARYRDRMFPRLPERLDVSIENRPVVLVPKRADIVRQPHAQLEFVYEIAFRSDSEPKRFDLVDGNYAGVPGYHRAAIRGRGTVQVVPAGPHELFARLPEIPEISDGETTTFLSVRKIEAFLRSTAPTAQVHNPQDTETNRTPELVASDRSQASVTQGDDSALSAGGPDDRPVASLQTSQSNTSNEGRSGADLGRFVWLAGFGGLALLIALAWFRSSRQPPS